MMRPDDSSRYLEVYQKTRTLMTSEQHGEGGTVQVWAPDRALLRRVMLEPFRPAGLKYLVYWSPRVLLEFRPALFFHLLVRLSFLLLHRVWVPGIMCVFYILMILSAYAEIRYAMLLGNALGHLGSVLLKKKNFIAADSQGIAFRLSAAADLQNVSAKFAPEYLPWHKIAALHHTYCAAGTGTLILETTDDRSIRVMLHGYSYETRQEICKIIAERAGLQVTRPSRRIWFPFGVVITPGRYLRPGCRYRPLFARSNPVKALSPPEPAAGLGSQGNTGR